MIYSMRTPTENMLKPMSELAAMARKQKEDLINADQNKIALESAAADRRYRDYMNEQTRRIQEEQRAREKAVKSRAVLKNSLMTECLMQLYKESAVGPMTKDDQTIARNLVSSFVKENGVDKLMLDFQTKNVLLSEFSRLVDKYYNKALNEATHGANEGEEDRPAIGLEVKECNFDQTLADDFFKDLADIDMEDASKMIKDRVSEAINQFIDDNAASKMEYQDIIQAAQDKITTTTTEEMALSYMNRAKLEIKEAKRLKEHSVFHCLVESLTRAAMTDEALKAKYVNEATVNMDAVVNSAALIYTMLEMANTTGMVNVNSKYIDEYLASLSA